jgi:hypothetical protein
MDDRLQSCAALFQRKRFIWVAQRFKTLSAIWAGYSERITKDVVYLVAPFAGKQAVVRFIAKFDLPNISHQLSFHLSASWNAIPHPFGRCSGLRRGLWFQAQSAINTTQEKMHNRAKKAPSGCNTGVVNGLVDSLKKPSLAPAVKRV